MVSLSSTVGVGAIPAGRGHPWARRGPRGGNRELPHEIGFDPGPQSRRKGWSPGESSASVRGPPPPPTTVRDPPIERRPSPALIKIRRKCPRGPSVGSAPAPSRREASRGGGPSRAGSVHGGIRPQQDPSRAGSVHGGVLPGRDPSTAGSFQGGIRLRRRRGPPILRAGQDRRWGGVEAVRGSPSPSVPTTPSPRSRLYPVETDVEGGAAGPATPRAAAEEAPFLRKEQWKLTVLPSRGRQARDRGRRSGSNMKRAYTPALR